MQIHVHTVGSLLIETETYKSTKVLSGDFILGGKHG